MVGAFDDFRGGDALVLLSGEAAGEDGLGDKRERNAQIGRRADHPLASPFLAGGVEDLLDEWLAGLRIAVAKNVARDFDQIAVELAGVPASEHVVQLAGTQ